MTLHTAFTELLDVRHLAVSAPMAGSAEGGSGGPEHLLDETESLVYATRSDGA